MGALFLVLYFAVALFNYSVVQSYLGAYASKRFTQEWGGEVRIGAMHVTPMGHVILKGVFLKSPTNDTIIDAERIAVHFKGIPLKNNTLSASYVALRNTYYHLGFCSDSANYGKINLQYIINHYASDKPDDDDTTSADPIVIKVGRLHLNNVHYKMDLKESEGHVKPENGVDIPHMEFSNIHARIKDIRVKASYVDCRIVKFQADEKSGFRLRDLSTDVSVSPSHIIATNMELQTDYSRLLLDAKLLYRDTWEMDPFCDSVEIVADIKSGSVASMRDAAYWAPVLWGINSTCNIEGYFQGPVADMKVSNLIATFGEESSLMLDGHVRGLPDITNTFFDVKLHQLHTTYEDAIEAYPLQNIALANRLMQDVEHLDMIMAVCGNLEECMLQANISTGVGAVDLYAQAKQNENDKRYHFQTNISSSGVNLNKVLPNEWVSETGVDLSATGSGSGWRDLVAEVHGELLNTTLQGNSMTPTTISADINKRLVTFEVAMNDTLADLGLVGSMDLRDTIGVYAADLQVNHCNLTKLNIVTDSSQSKDVVVNTQLRVDARCKEFEHLNAEVAIDNTNIVWNGEPVKLGLVELRVKDNNVKKNITLNSDFARFAMDGYFSYANIGLIYKQFMSQYVPIYFCNTPKLTEQETMRMVGDQFGFDLVWNDKKHLLPRIMPNLKIANGTTLHGNYNFTESLKLVMRSDSVGYGSLQLHDVGMNSGPQGGHYQLKVDASEFALSGASMAAHPIIKASITKKNANLGLKWGASATDMFRGDVAFTLFSDTTINHIHVIKPLFYINNEKWTLRCPEGIQFAKGSIVTKQLAILSDNHSIDIRTNINGNTNDHIDFAINNINLGHLSEWLLKDNGLKLDGSLYGNGVLFGVTTDPHLNANIHLAEFLLNDYEIGDVDVSAQWLSTEKQIELELSSLLETDSTTLSPITAMGLIDMGGSKPGLNMDVDIDHFKLNALQPILSSFSSDLTGELSGTINIAGTTQKPIINGRAEIENTSLVVSPTGVRYHINDSISIANNLVKLNNLTVSDPQNNKLGVTGNIDCSDLNAISLNLAVATDNIMLLNNRKSAEYPYYGTLMAAVNGTIKGTTDNLNIVVNAQTMPGSEVTVPIDDKRQVQTADYITFVGDDEDIYVNTQGSRFATKRQSSPLHLILNANVTPDVQLNIPITLGQISMQVGATGLGDLVLTLANNEVPTVKGIYEIVNGEMILRLMSLVKKNFSIENGSVLEFPGDIASTRFDIKAIYGHRTNLSSLTGSLSSENAQQSVLVESIIALAGTIDQPEIKFDMRLPNADQSVSEEVFAYIDRNNERDMLNQTISLLVLGQFANASTASPIEQDVAGSGYQMVANTLGSAVTSLVKVVNVDFEYKAATSLTTEQFDVDISKSWNKFYFESTFGYGGEANNLSEIEGNGNLVGDMLVGYKINPRLHLFAFNRTNSDYYTRTELPFKQGLGIKLTRDFNKWGDLFKRNKKK